MWKWKKEAREIRAQQEADEKQKVKEEHEKALRALKEAEEKLKSKGNISARPSTLRDHITLKSTPYCSGRLAVAYSHTHSCPCWRNDAQMGSQ